MCTIKGCKAEFKNLDKTKIFALENDEKLMAHEM
jgi:hypothetical protein